MSRAAVYVRISRDREGAGLGVQRQEADCRELAARHGLDVTSVYVDNDLSAYSGKRRPEYVRLVDDVANGRVDAILAWHTDRLHRSPTELEQYITVCEARGVPTFTVKAGPLDLSTPSGRMVARQLGAVARYEVEHQVERQQRAKLQAATAGQWGGGRRPYGYEADGVTIRPEEARVVAQVTEAVLLGASLRAQTALLNDQGLRTSTGRPWQPTELRRVLMRARNAGLREHHGEVVGPAQWPALVDEEHWRAVCFVLGNPDRRTSWSTARRWLLAGIARCGVCGDHLRAVLLNSSRAGVPSYTCRAGKCVVRNATELDQHVAAVVIARLSLPDAAGLLCVEGGPDVSQLRIDATVLRQRLDDLAAMFAEGVVDARQLREGTQRIQAKLEAAEHAIGAAARPSVLAGVADAADVAEAWATLSIERRRAIVDALMTVTVHRTRKGRPAQWRPGQSYFNPDTIEITPTA